VSLAVAVGVVVGIVDRLLAFPFYLAYIHKANTLLTPWGKRTKLRFGFYQSSILARKVWNTLENIFFLKKGFQRGGEATSYLWSKISKFVLKITFKKQL
jgi:hypothetical protein